MLYSIDFENRKSFPEGPYILVTRPCVSTSTATWSYEVQVLDRVTLLQSNECNEHMSIRRVALKYDVPKSTLHDRLIGKIMVGGQSGLEKYLTDEE